MSGGMVLEEAEIDLEANGQEAQFIEELFPTTDTSDFVGSVRCTAPGLFTGIAVELDAVNRIFTTLPVARTGGGGQEAGLDFAHFANGAGIISDLVLVNRSTRPSGPGPTPFHTVILPTRPALYFYDKGGNPMDPESVVDLTEDLEVTEDGALTVRTEMEPLGELTISTHGRGEVVSGSVKVISDGPIGGVLRFDLPGIGVAGVGASQPVRDAIFPARREGDLSTAAAIRNLGEEAMEVSCRLMSGGHRARRGGDSSGGQRAGSPVHRRDVHKRPSTSDFVGSVRCMAPSEGEGMFTGVAVELDEDNQIFTTLPVVPVPERTVSGNRCHEYPDRPRPELEQKGWRVFRWDFVSGFLGFCHDRYGVGRFLLLRGLNSTDVSLLFVSGLPLVINGVDLGTCMGVPLLCGGFGW